MLAETSIVIAFIHAGYLLAAAKAASLLSKLMRSTLNKIGAEMAVAIDRTDLTPFHVGTLILAVVSSASMVWRNA